MPNSVRISEEKHKAWGGGGGEVESETAAKKLKKKKKQKQKKHNTVCQGEKKCQSVVASEVPWHGG